MLLQLGMVGLDDRRSDGMILVSQAFPEKKKKNRAQVSIFKIFHGETSLGMDC